MVLVSTGQITIVDLDDGKTQYTHLAWCNASIEYDEAGRPHKTTYSGFTKDPKEGSRYTHIGIYQDFNFVGSDDPEDYTWSKWKGSDGANGIPGKPGADGRTPYVHFAYADSPDGYKGFTTSEMLAFIDDIDSEPTKVKVDVTAKIYMGTYTDYTEEDSQDPKRYQWQKVRGADGANGTPGKPGADGRTPYVHFAYADSADGRTGFTVYGDPNKKYMGTYTDFTQADSTDPTKYKWSLIKGADGANGAQGIQGPQGPKGDQGIPGQRGADGRTQYTHIAYADNAFGAGMSQTDSNKQYIGVYQDFNAVDSTNPNSYKWTKWKGDDGVNGLPGPKGADGRTPYVHFAYSNSANGTSGFSVSDSSGKEYIGTYTDFTQADSTNPNVYKWTKIKGSDGAPGKAGADGKTSYVHFAYAESKDGRKGFSIGSSVDKYYIGTYTDFTQADSTDPTRYKWTSLNGDISVGGRNLWIKNKCTGFAAIEKLPDGHVTGQTECYRLESTQGKNSIIFNLAPEFTKKLYGKVAFQAWIKYENVVSNGQGYSKFNCFKSRGLYKWSKDRNVISPVSYPNLFGFTGTSGWFQIKSVYDFGSDPNYDHIRSAFWFVLEGVKSGTAWVTGIKVEVGNTVTDYSIALEDLEDSISSKADLNVTQEQLNRLSERNDLLKAELEAKASQSIVDEWVAQIKNVMAVDEAGRKDAESAVLRASERITDLQNKVGELKIMTEFVNTYMSQSEEGIIVGQKDGSSKVMVSTDRISFISGGREVASISQGVLQIDNGVFVKSLRIGRFVTMQDPLNLDRNLTLYVGGVI